MPRISNQRHLFDIPHSVAYFNCAYNSPQLKAVRSALIKGAKSKSQPWLRTPESFFEDAERVRGLSAALFGGRADGYAIVPAASYGISTAARALEPTLRPGDQIIVLQEEFPSNVLPWRRVAQETGAEVVTIERVPGADLSERIASQISERTRVLALSSCQWTDGSTIDLPAVVKGLDRDKVCVVIDATQSLGAIPFSVEEIDPDFMVAAGYKWLMCPYGSGIMYVSKRWHPSRPLEESWLARENSLNFAALADYSETYLPGARKFDVGEKCVPTILPGVIKAFEQLQAWGVENIASRLSEVNTRIANVLLDLGFGVKEEKNRSPHMFGATLPHRYCGDILHCLKMQDVYISARGNAIRFSPHLHITNYDTERLLSAITTAIR